MGGMRVAFVLFRRSPDVAKQFVEILAVAASKTAAEDMRIEMFRRDGVITELASYVVVEEWLENSTETYGSKRKFAENL